MKRLLGVPVLVAGLMAFPQSASAHPLGNFTINQYVGILVTPSSVEIEYVVDMAEIPAFQERQVIDEDGDDFVSNEEAERYRSTACKERSAELALSYDGAPIQLSENAVGSISFPPGQAGLVTLRLECSYLAMGNGSSFNLENGNYAERAGWREIVVSSKGVGILSELPADSPSERLTVYPKDPSSATLDVRRATVKVGGASTPGAVEVLVAPITGTPADALGSLISRGNLGLGAALLALVAAMALGAGHALAPGHGKTIIAAYMVGNRGTARQALGLGLAVALSHTLGVLALGLATFYATRSFQPERVYPYLSAISGLIVLAIGIGLVVRTLLRIRHDRAHVHGNEHHHDHEHAHPPIGIGWKGLMALGITGGLVPSASAVVLLLGAVNLGRVEFGLALVGAFGIGMALSMLAVGLGLVAATRFGFKRLSDAPWIPRLTAILPAAMGVVVTLVGAVMLSTAGRNLFAA